MRVFFACLVLLSACAPHPEPASPAVEVSAFRTGFRASFLAACERELVAASIAQDEIAFACPCMLDYVLAKAPTDAALVQNGEALKGPAAETCVAQAKERFPRA